MTYDEQHPIGRIRVPDPRDRAYAFFGPKAIVARHEAIAVSDGRVAQRAVARGSRHHKRGVTLNQGRTSRCTLFALAQVILSGPVMETTAKLTAWLDSAMKKQGLLPAPESFDAMLTRGYQWAQQNDEWPGEGYEGTSGRAAAQWYRQLGVWPTFHNTTTAEEDVDYLLRFGPLAVGCDWFTGMDSLDAKGYIRPTGTLRGGHEFCVDAVKLDTPGRPDLDGDLEMHQSWGTKANGAPFEIAKIRLSDWRYLRSLGADTVAVATEIRL